MTIAFAPGFADVGFSARTTVAVANGSRRAARAVASAKNGALIGSLSALLIPAGERVPDAK